MNKASAEAWGDYKAMFSQVQSAHAAQPNKLEELIMDDKAKHRITRRPVLVIAAIVLAALLSVSAYAIVTLLTPAQVAREIGDKALAAAFEDGKGTLINESVTSHGYIFTLHGMTSGKNLSDFYPNADADTEQTFLVFSARRADGSPIKPADLKNGFPFMSGAFFSGYKPWMFSSFLLGSGVSALEKDGVYYMLFNVDDNIEMLADRTVTFAIWDGDLGIAPGAALLKMEDDGTIAFVDGLDKAHAMFTLPLDASKADPAKVERILEELGMTEEDIAFMQDPNAVYEEPADLEDAGAYEWSEAPGGTNWFEED